MKYFCISCVVMSFLLGIATPSAAVTVYFRNGSHIDVESATRVGNSVYLLININEIDTSRTRLEELPESQPSSQPRQGLILENVDFSPSTDNTEIIATGDVINNSAYAVQNVQVTVILKDKHDVKLLTIRSHVRPGKILPGHRGSYRLQVKKPENFWRASVDVSSEVVK